MSVRVVMGGREYPSMRAAADALGMSKGAFWRRANKLGEVDGMAVELIEPPPRRRQQPRGGECRRCAFWAAARRGMGVCGMGRRLHATSREFELPITYANDSCEMWEERI